jgi:hypothetical protein
MNILNEKKLYVCRAPFLAALPPRYDETLTVKSAYIKELIEREETTKNRSTHVMNYCPHVSAQKLKLIPTAQVFVLIELRIFQLYYFYEEQI